VFLYIHRVAAPWVAQDWSEVQSNSLLARAIATRVRVRASVAHAAHAIRLETGTSSPPDAGQDPGQDTAATAPLRLPFG